jgi:hypothetical protein
MFPEFTGPKIDFKGLEHNTSEGVIHVSHVTGKCTEIEFITSGGMPKKPGEIYGN